jgi:hypothetical protein
VPLGSSLSLQPAKNFFRLLNCSEYFTSSLETPFFYQKLKRKFCSTALWYIIHCHPHEARKFFHWLHPFLEVFYTSFIQTVYFSTEFVTVCIKTF